MIGLLVNFLEFILNTIIFHLIFRRSQKSSFCNKILHCVKIVYTT